MTQEHGSGIHNYFQLKTYQTIELGDQQYLQAAENQETGEHSILYRSNGRYSTPVELEHGIKNQRDAEQILVAAEQDGLKQLRERLQP